MMHKFSELSKVVCGQPIEEIVFSRPTCLFGSINPGPKRRRRRRRRWNCVV